MIFTLVHYTKYDFDVPDTYSINANSLAVAVKAAEEKLNDVFCVAVSRDGSAVLKLGDLTLATFENYHFKDYTDTAYIKGYVGNISRIVECMLEVSPNLQKVETETCLNV